MTENEQKPVQETAEKIVDPRQTLKASQHQFPVHLPSRGMLYEGKLGEGIVYIRPMTTKEESILYSPVGDGASKIDNLIRSCLTSKEVSPDELLSVDRFAILLSIRTLTHGASYTFPFRCRDCRAQFKTTVDIVEDFDIRYMGDEVWMEKVAEVYGSEEPFTVTLPVSGDEISFVLLRGKDEKRIAMHAKRVRMATTDPDDPSYCYRMATIIKGINGKAVTTLQTERYVGRMHSRDSNALRLALDAVEGGIITKCYPVCNKCGFTNECNMPFDLEFFRPNRV